MVIHMHRVHMESYAACGTVHATIDEAAKATTYNINLACSNHTQGPPKSDLKEKKKHHIPCSVLGYKQRQEVAGTVPNMRVQRNQILAGNDD